MTTRYKIAKEINDKRDESLRIDYETLESKQLVMSSEIAGRIKMLLEEVDQHQRDGRNYFWGSIIFFIVMLVGAFAPFAGAIIAWIGGLIGVMVMWHYGNKVMYKSTKKMGFIDGIFFVVTTMTRELGTMMDKDDIPEELKQKMREVEKELEELDRKADTMKE